MKLGIFLKGAGMNITNQNKELMYGLDLFSGIAGNTIGLRQYIKTVAYCENDRHAQSVLLSRMADGSIEPAPIWDDITTLKGDMFNVPIDIIVGGFPCQDISTAGKGAGLGGQRSGLVFEVLRLIKELQPTFVFLENVPAIRIRGGERVVKELAALGYDCRWDTLSASDVGAPHKRERWFLLGKRRESLAHPSSKRHEPEFGAVVRETEERQSESSLSSSSSSTTMASQKLYCSKRQGQWWEIESPVGRVVDELPFRLDRLKRLGNAVVPLQAKVAFEKLIGKK
jgi:DNA (cytosine-5)-methyltransferase 1